MSTSSSYSFDFVILALLVTSCMMSVSILLISSQTKCDLASNDWSESNRGFGNKKGKSCRRFSTSIMLDCPLQLFANKFHHRADRLGRR